jgi:hypothetical protein
VLPRATLFLISRRLQPLTFPSLFAKQDDKVGLEFGRDEVHDYFVKAQMP